MLPEEGRLYLEMLLEDSRVFRIGSFEKIQSPHWTGARSFSKASLYSCHVD